MTNNSLIIGTINKDTITGRSLENKTQPEFVTTKKAVFLDLQRQASQKLYHSGDFEKGNTDVIRYNHVYSNKRHMHTDDLWFILTECVTTDKKSSYYELTLSTYNED